MRKHICDRCLHYFYTQTKLDVHEAQCAMLNDTCLLELPSPGRSVTEFRNFRYKEKVPFIVYADCECLIKAQRVQEGTIVVTHKHEIYSMGLYIKGSYDDSLSCYNSYRGPAAAWWFANELKDIVMQVDELYRSALPMLKLSTEQEEAYRHARICHICEGKFGENEVRVRDHCHLTGKYRGRLMRAVT